MAVWRGRAWAVTPVVMSDLLPAAEKAAACRMTGRGAGERPIAATAGGQACWRSVRSVCSQTLSCSLGLRDCLEDFLSIVEL